MKILVFSDSHSGLSFMRRTIEAVKPDTVIHLGDYYDDGETMRELFPHIRFHQVPGNCDRFRCVQYHPEVLCYDVGGVRMFMTHGHRHNVKMDPASLIFDARKSGAAIALYGHTHEADLHRETDGLWVMNPGACGYKGGSAGLILTDGREIISCKILRYNDLEELK